MHATYKNALMWTLYGVLFLLIAVLQTVVFGRARFFGVKLTLIPVCIACVSMLAGAEAGGNPNWIVIVIGNAFVCLMEGLIVGIQVLRLEYYEIFSRFYAGNGREFKPFMKAAHKN